jgi:branched-chain amino acid transport system substrate-binding protein
MRRLLLMMIIVLMGMTAPALAQAEPAVCAADEWGCARIAPGDTLKFAIGAPLTGDSAGLGLAYSQALQLAIAQSEPILGFGISQVDENDRGAVDGALAAAERIIADPTIVGIVGHAFSGASRATMPLYEEAGIVMLSPTATNPTLTQMGSRVFNRAIFNDNEQGELAARYLYEVLNVRRLALLNDGSIYSAGLAGIARDIFTELGGTVVFDATLEPGHNDYVDVLRQVRAAMPEALFFPGYTAEVSFLVQGLSAAGLGDVVFVAADGVNTQTLVEIAGSAAEGIYLTGESLPPESPQKQAFDTLYRATFGVDPLTVSRAIWTAYDSANVLIDAARSVAVLGGDGALYIPRGALIAAVRNTVEYEGINGLLRCDAAGECNTVGPDMSYVQNGTSVRVPLTALREGE